MSCFATNQYQDASWGNFYYISSMTKRIPRKLYLSRNGWRIKNNKRWSSFYLFILWLRSTWRPHISGGSGNFLSLCLMIMYVFSSHELLCIWYIDQISPWGWGVEVETTARSSAFLQTSNTLGNSDDTSCQTKLYQRATSFSSSTSGPKTIYLNLFFFFFKYPYQICSQTLRIVIYVCSIESGEEMFCHLTESHQITSNLDGLERHS